MREFLLVVPDLVAAAASSYEALADRADARLRFGVAHPLPRGWRSWVLGRIDRAAFEADSIAAVVAAAMGASGETPPGGELRPWLATALHFVPGLDTVHLPRHGILSLDPADQEQLAAGFDVEWGRDGLALRPAGPESFLLSGLDCGEPQTSDPLDCLGGDLAALQPAGDGARELRRLMSEIEMWLHAHPVNVRRAMRGQPAVSTLWLWGGATPERPATIVGTDDASDGPQPDGSARWRVQADDAWTRAVARLAGFDLVEGAPQAPVGDSADEPDQLIVARRYAPDVQDLAAFEHRHLAAALAALRDGTLRRLTIVTADRAIAVEAADRYRFWRPRRGWLTALQA